MPVDQKAKDQVMSYLKQNGTVQGFREASYNYSNGEVSIDQTLATPTGLTPTGGSLQISCAFTTVADATAYVVEYNKASTPTVKASKRGTSSPIVLTGLDAATSYKVRIKAVAGTPEADIYQSDFSADSTVSTS